MVVGRGWRYAAGMPTGIRLASCLLVLALAPVCAWPAHILELRDFQLIDGTGAPARHVSRLVAREGMIVAIDGRGEVPSASAEDRWQTLELAGAWIMPGLVDTHVHVGRFPEARTQAELILANAARHGVTAVLDLGAMRALWRTLSVHWLQGNSPDPRWCTARCSPVLRCLPMAR